MTVDAEALTTERNKSHGDWMIQACATNEIKELMRRYKNWELMDSFQTEALDMIATKLGRILAGDPDFKDHYDDIAGYAYLVSKHLK